MLTLKVEKRVDNGASASALRRTGFVPGIVYSGHYKATPVAVRSIAFSKVLREAGEATIVSLNGLGLPGQGESLPTLIHEVDLDPITNLPRHVDFYAVTKGEKVEVHIPLVFVGVSEAVEKGANLIKVMHELEVKADPMSLPHNIEVNVSALAALGDKIHVSDLILPKDITFITPPEEVVALVQEIVEEKEEEVIAPADISSIEVEKKGKEAAATAAESESPVAPVVK